MLGLMLLISACSGSTAADRGGDVDVAAAASDAEAAIANYAASLPSVPGAAPPSPTPAAAVGTRRAETPEQVVRRYTDAIARRRYDEAWRLWEGQGRASGLTGAEFADGFARYASFEATIGRPYDADGGAGQRFVTVPVTVTGMLRTGEPFRLEGPVILHKAADGIESDDPDAHYWRLRSSEMKPRPIARSRPAS